MSCPLRYATKRELPPNISAYPVARRVVMQAVNNTWNRVRRGKSQFSALAVRYLHG